MLQATQVTLEDIKRSYALFIDTKRSTAFLKQYKEDFLYHENDDEMDDE